MFTLVSNSDTHEEGNPLSIYLEKEKKHVTYITVNVFISKNREPDACLSDDTGEAFTALKILRSLELTGAELVRIKFTDDDK